MGGHGRHLLGSAIFFDNAAYLGHGHKLIESTSMALSPSLPITAISESSISTITSTVAKLELSWTRIPQQLQLGEHRSGRFRKGFEDMEPGRHHQRSHESRGRRSQPVRLSDAERLVP